VQNPQKKRQKKRLTRENGQRKKEDGRTMKERERKLCVQEEQEEVTNDFPALN
jgi:hypothetical protein